MPLCGFNAKMIQGIGLFAQGLFEAVLDRARERGVSMEEAFGSEIAEISAFLGALEEKYQSLRRVRPVREAVEEVVEWMASRDTGDRTGSRG
jgi:hypothetical protein